MRYLVTSALPYINGIKHLGNLVGSMLPADVYSRFLRQEGEEVLFICGTDEHGTPAELAALEEGITVAEYCQRQYELQADVYQRFGLSFDHFGRTSSPEHRELTQHFYQQLEAQGFIEEREISQMYSLTDERFLPDRYVEGTCPKCGYTKARGDQCENCTSVLNPTDLLEPRSAISGSTDLEIRQSKHLFLRLDKLSAAVEAWVEDQTDWPPLTKSIARKWLKEGLQSRGITRDLQWGVPVPRAGFEHKVFYVWFDAPIGYLSITKAWAAQAEGRDWLSWWQPEAGGKDGRRPGLLQRARRLMRDWLSWWQPEAGGKDGRRPGLLQRARRLGRDWLSWWQPEAGEVRYVQFMAKDNLPFHTILWPATILGTREPWKLADYIKGFNWLNYYGGKFSTSSKRGVFLDQALEILPADYWRYALIANAPESSDSAFTWEQFQVKVNKDLADNLGNFVNRILKFAASRFDSQIPAGGEPGPAEQQLEATCREKLEAIATHLRGMEFRKAADTLNALWTVGNQYIDERAPWALFKTDRDQAALVIRTCIHLIRIYAIAARPFLPFTAETLSAALRLSPAEQSSCFAEAVDFTALEPGRPFDVPPPLFQKLDDDRLAALRTQFGGEAAQSLA